MSVGLKSWFLLIWAAAPVLAQDIRSPYAPDERRFEAFKLPQERMLYRKPLLASGPAIGLQGVLAAGTELLLVYRTRSKEWVFVKREDGLEGWIPSAWIREPYAINLADVRLRFYPDPEEIEVPFELSTDVEVWGDDLLLEALGSGRP